MRIFHCEIRLFLIAACLFLALIQKDFSLATREKSMGSGTFLSSKKISTNSNLKFGEIIDSLDGIYVYYNGNTNTVKGISKTVDGYNLGLKYQCVEFIKRYYYKYYGFKMYSNHGHAVDFYDHIVEDSHMNLAKGLRQYTNGSISKPRKGDILVFDKSTSNHYGHVGIISSVSKNSVELIHQNPGPRQNSRHTFTLDNINNKWFIRGSHLLGWLRIT